MAWKADNPPPRGTFHATLRGAKNLVHRAVARPTRCAQLRGTWSLSGRCAALGCHGNGIQIFPNCFFIC